MADVLKQLVKYWSGQGVSPATAKETSKDVAAWEEKFGVCLPSDLREYVTRVNGTLRGEELEFGKDMMSFLPLRAMLPEAQYFKEDYKEPGMFVFIDYLISSYWWCIRLTPKSSTHTQIFVRGTKLKLVANSLEEFLLSYMAESKYIHP